MPSITALPAKKIDYAYDLSNPNGAGLILEFDIASNTVIEFGEIVGLTAGKVVSAGTGGTAALLGMAAEPHDGASPGRQSGKKIKVYCSPTAVFKCRPAQTVENTGVSATTFTDAAYTSTNDLMNGGYLKMLSISTLTVTTAGGLVPVTDSAAAGTLTGVFTGNLADGDEALLLPPVGQVGFELNADSTNLNLKSAANSITTIQIVDVDPVQELVYFTLALHKFGAKVS